MKHPYDWYFILTKASFSSFAQEEKAGLFFKNF